MKIQSEYTDRKNNLPFYEYLDLSQIKPCQDWQYIQCPSYFGASFGYTPVLDIGSARYFEVPERYRYGNASLSESGMEPLKDGFYSGSAIEFSSHFFSNRHSDYDFFIRVGKYSYYHPLSLESSPQPKRNSFYKAELGMYF